MNGPSVNDLDDRLHRASEAARAATSGLPVPPMERARRRVRRTVAVRAFAGAAAVLLAVLGVTAVLRGGTSAQPPADASTTTVIVDDWAQGWVVLSESPRVVQAHQATPAEPPLDGYDEVVLSTIDGLTPADVEAIGVYTGDDPIIAVGEFEPTGERLFVVPPGWSGAPGGVGTCYVFVGGGTGAFCDEDLNEPLLRPDPPDSIRLVGPVPEGTVAYAATVRSSAGVATVWQRPRGGYVFLTVDTAFPATVAWEMRGASEGAVLRSGEIDGVGGDLPSCSAAGMSIPSAQAGLPVNVAELRRDIVRAASLCDFAALAELAADGFTSSFGGGGIELLAEREAEGDDLLATLVEVLEMPYAEVSYEDGTTYYYWPRAFSYDSWDEVPEADKDDLRSLYSDEDFAGFATFGGYIGWRAGITADGEWTFFVAGD